MKKILFLILVAMTSCGVEYDAETRLVLQTQLKDSQGNTITAKPIEIWVSDNGFTDKISDGVTDQNGSVRLIFPAPNNTGAPIEIRFPEGSQFRDKHLVNILRDDFTDYKLTLDLILHRPEELTNLSIELFSNSGNTLLALEVENNPGAQYVYFNALQDSFEPNTFHRVQKNSTVDIVYKVRNAAGVESIQTVPIAIGENDVTYTLAY